MSDYHCSKCQAEASFSKENGVQRSCDCNASVIMNMGEVSMEGKSTLNATPELSLEEKIKIGLLRLIQLVNRDH